MVAFQTSHTMPRLGLGDEPQELGACVPGWPPPHPLQPPDSTDTAMLIFRHLFLCK